MTSRRRMRISPGLLGGVFALSLGLWAAYLLADGSGKTGYATSSSGCSCHGSNPNAAGAVTVSISGPQTLMAGATGNYTFSVTGGPSGSTGGFDLKASGGTFTPGSNNRGSSTELTHMDNGSRSWSFKWTAPTTSGSYAFRGVGMCSNGSGSSGDSWNWYGNAVSTPFSITVGPGVDTTPPAAVKDLQ